jgi:hypothetical protein
MRQTTTAGMRHDEGKTTSFMRNGAEPIDSAARGTHRGWGFLPCTDNGARLSRNPRRIFFLGVSYLTLLDLFLNDALG